MKTYIYYSTLRPVSIGTYPKEGMVSFHNFDKRTYCPDIEWEAWGYLEYDRELTKKEMESYDLTAPFDDWLV